MKSQLELRAIRDNLKKTLLGIEKMILPDESEFIGDKYVDEPILNSENEQITFYPIKNHEMNNMYEEQEKNFWTVNEVDLSNDIKDLEKMSTDEKMFIYNVLAFFAGSDGLVIKNVQRFSDDVKDVHTDRVYTFQKMMEFIHSQMYGNLLNLFIPNEKLKQHYLNALETIPCIKKKGDWTIKWTNSDKTYSHRIIANAVVEGIFFSGSFCAIYWLAEKGIMQGFSLANKFIARDESLHTMTAVLIYLRLKNKLKQKVVYEIVDEAVNMEIEFICESLPCKLIGMNSNLMSDYIKNVADRLLVSLGYEKKYMTENPFPFMEKIGLQSVTNFFERRVGEYQKGIKNADYNIADAINSAINGVSLF